MSTEMTDDDAMSFAEPAAVTAAALVAPWKMLVVDDDEEVHRVTRLALSDFTLHGRPLQFLDAYTGRESVEIMRHEKDVALILMDVVMETDHAGLDAVQAIRNELGNKFVRIVLRTGQPGQAPEGEVVRRFDINDYKEKTELTAKKLYTLMHTGLSHYRELIAMEQNRAGLERVIDASASIFELQSLAHFARGVLQQLAALLYAREDAVIIAASGVAATREAGNDLRLLAGTGEYTRSEGQLAEAVLPALALKYVREALATQEPVMHDHHFAVHFVTRSGADHVVYLSSESPFQPADARLVQMFCRNVAIAFENLGLHQELSESQNRMVLLLSSAIEERSVELRNHVKRVSAYSVLLGSLRGLAADDLKKLSLAAAMHDLGKIAVPDAILNKPGPFTPEERKMMETHVIRGQQMLEGQRGELMRAAGIVVSQHHERWDGAGYPLGLAGDGIHLFGRITSIADVFDALTTTRCYKQPWPIEQVTNYFGEQRGVQFDPKLVDLFLANLAQFLEIKAQLYQS